MWPNTIKYGSTLSIAPGDKSDETDKENHELDHPTLIHHYSHTQPCTHRNRLELGFVIEWPGTSTNGPRPCVWAIIAWGWNSSIIALLIWSFLHYSGDNFAAYALGFSTTSLLLIVAGMRIAAFATYRTERLKAKI